MNAKPTGTKSTAEQVIEWLFTVIAVFLFIRLLVFIVRLLSDAAGLLGSGTNFLDRLGDLSLRNIIAQVIIIAVLVAIYLVSKKSPPKK